MNDNLSELLGTGEEEPGQPIPLSVGKEYQMDVVGEIEKKRGTFSNSKRRLPFGWINRVRVFVCDPPKNDDLSEDYKYKEVVNVQPGDRIDAKIIEHNPKSANAILTYNYGSFIPELMEKNKELEVIITGKSDRDMRDAISDPRYENGGLYGVFTIIERTRYEEPDFSNMLEDHEFKKKKIRMTYFSKGKTGKYFIIAELVNKSQERDLEREIYVGKWLKSGWGEVDGKFIEHITKPNLKDIPLYFKGIPNTKKPSIALYFKNEKERQILFRSGPRNISRLNPKNAVREFVNWCFPGTFKVAIAQPEAIDQLINAIELVGFNYDTLDENYNSIQFIL